MQVAKMLHGRSFTNIEENKEKIECINRFTQMIKAGTHWNNQELYEENLKLWKQLRTLFDDQKLMPAMPTGEWKGSYK